MSEMCKSSHLTFLSSYLQISSRLNGSNMHTTTPDRSRGSRGIRGSLWPLVTVVALAASKASKIFYHSLVRQTQQTVKNEKLTKSRKCKQNKKEPKFKSMWSSAKFKLLISKNDQRTPFLWFLCNFFSIYTFRGVLNAQFPGNFYVITMTSFSSPRRKWRHRHITKIPGEFYIWNVPYKQEKFRSELVLWDENSAWTIVLVGKAKKTSFVWPNLCWHCVHLNEITSGFFIRPFLPRLVIEWICYWIQGTFSLIPP